MWRVGNRSGSGCQTFTDGENTHKSRPCQLQISLIRPLMEFFIGRYSVRIG